MLLWSQWEGTGALVERVRAECPGWDVARTSFAPGGADVEEL